MRNIARRPKAAPHAARHLLPLVYDDLRRLAACRLAHEAPGQALEPTDLVHEVYLRLVGTDRRARWDSRGHFFAAPPPEPCGASSSKTPAGTGHGNASASVCVKPWRG
jgi:hypothetical protein